MVLLDTNLVKGPNVIFETPKDVFVKSFSFVINSANWVFKHVQVSLCQKEGDFSVVGPTLESRIVVK